MKKEYEEWIEYAEKDLEVAKFNIKGGYSSAGAFYLQQSAEKALKALIIKEQKRLVKNEIIKLLNKFIGKVKGVDLQKVILFGSQTTGHATEESDIDLIVVSEDFEKMGFFERVKTIHKQCNFNYSVDFLCYTLEEFERKKNRISIVSEALKEGVVII